MIKWRRYLVLLYQYDNWTDNDPIITTFRILQWLN
jgi:hypothetical protein